MTMKSIRIFTTALFALLPIAPASAQGDVTDRVEQACTADIQRFCAGVERGEGALLNCIAGHYSQLSNSCRQALDAAGTGEGLDDTDFTKDTNEDSRS